MPQVFHRSSNTLVKLSFIAGVLAIGSLFLFGSTLTRSPLATKATVPLDQPVPFSHRHHAKELGIDCRYCHTSVEVSPFAGIPPTETCMSCHSQIWTNSPLLEPVRESYRSNSPIKMKDGTPGWNRVNSVPDFVYFNHSIHIKKGVSCFNCHSNIQEMTLTYKSQPFWMSFCLDCHRNPEKYIRPREEVTNFRYQPPSDVTPLSPAILKKYGWENDPPKDQEDLGNRLVKLYKINKHQITNCSVCHR